MRVLSTLPPSSAIPAWPGSCLTLLCSCWTRSISILRLHREAGKSGRAKASGPRPLSFPAPPGPAQAPAHTHPLTPLCGKERKRGQGSSFSHCILSPLLVPRQSPRGWGLSLLGSEGGVAHRLLPHLSPPAAPSAAPPGWPSPPSLPPAPPAGSRSQSAGARPRAPGPAGGPAPPAECGAPAAAAPGRMQVTGWVRGRPGASG